MKKPQCGGGCLGAPMRALSRACKKACDLYVRGMSGCAGHVPSATASAVGRGGYMSPSASPMVLRTRSDRVEDLVRAAATAKQQKQGRRVAPAEVADATGTTKRSKVVVPERKKIATAGMETIAEDATCEFDTCALPPPSRRRGRAAGGRLATRSSGFGVGSDVFVS